MFLRYHSGRLGQLKNMNGQAIVEFALVAMVFFVMLFAIMDLAIMLYVNLTMQHAVREGTRLAITGQPGSTATGAQRWDAMKQKIKDSSMGLYDKNLNGQKDPVVSILPHDAPASSPVYANFTGTRATATDPTGKPDDIILVKLTYSWRLITPVLRPFFPNGIYTFTVKSTMKNEHYPTS